VVCTSMYKAQFVNGKKSFFLNFDMYWFAQTGNILIHFMIINAYMPIVI